MKLSRRQFVQQSAGAALAAGAVGGCASPEAREAERDGSGSRARLPIVDTHQHLWDLTKFRLAWLDGTPALKKSFVTEDFRAATRGLNVVKAVYMEVDVDPSQQVAEAEHVIALSRSSAHPTVAAVISGRPASEQFKAYITRFKDTPEIKGVRQVLQGSATPQGYCLGVTFMRSVQLLGELGKSFDLCMRPAELSDGVMLADACPDTRFIVDHCGNADPTAFLPARRRPADSDPWHEAHSWRRDMASLAQRKNVVCKISGIVARAVKGSWGPADLAPIINHCLDVFGPDRVMFGGDWPVCTLVASYREWVEALEEVIADRTEAEQRKLLADNAVRFYGLA